ncbi:polysaccharide pyruvyl transferase family protein [Acinetobacter terrae]|uniref:Polysaccharide pyruvyl transferase family protein n=1 Tax=Acinetobacter terrae TaxID=2731247 RepID=A0A8E4FB33_9GAMM|nr:polysaccharide pyruvyl transferase family protein [Acinetobacter terrae]NNH38940.1 polysaccharide pyruvyl transferase family protein [Acinetobacter terrae]
MNPKVAILTQPLHTNYGGTLQAYALQTIVKSVGAEVVTLNYQTKPKFFLRFLLSVIKSFVLNRKDKFPLLSSEKLVIEKYHTEFIKKHINRSEIILSELDLIKHFNNTEYDAIIVGSDQVWRVEYSPNIDNFFLNVYTGSAKRISYAASFGIDEWQFTPEKTSEIETWLGKFDAISVREDSAVTLCKNYLNLKAYHVLDPTLLLTKEYYLNLIKKSPQKDTGIFTYILDSSQEKNNIVANISKKLGLNTFQNQPIKKFKTNFFIKKEDDYVYPKIEDWLAAFRDASFIITDSFHGTVFSIIFNKPFITVANRERGVARFSSLLKIFNLEHRLISSLDQLTNDLILSNIDFNEVNTILDHERENSLQLLYKQINL